MPTTICFINQKGGCGKSSSCFHLAGAFAQLNRRVLLVDADPQGSLGQAFFGSETIENLTTHDTLAAVFSDGVVSHDNLKLIQPTPFDRISICPSNHHLHQHNTPRPATTGMEQHAIWEFVQAQSEFDLILFDCPPNLYRCTWTAMIAADYVIIPVPPEDFGTQGLRAVHQAVENARQLNPQLRRLGHLVTRSDSRLLVHKSYERKLRGLYPELVFETVIPEATAFKVALTCRQPVQFYAKRSKAADLTRKLAREILDRISMKNAESRVA